MTPPTTKQPPPFRKEVQDFIQATETLFSPDLPTPALSRQECDIVAYYIVNLAAARHPWTKSLFFGTR